MNASSPPALPLPTRPAPWVAATAAATADRLDLLDVLRGFALPGILLMNIEWFTRPLAELGEGLPPGLAGADALAAWLIYVLVQGKFWVLFSLLFGAGFAVLQARADAVGAPFVAPFVRRAGLLFVLGVAHALLLWVGDILHTYALAAIGLLLFRRVEPLARGVTGVLLFALLTFGIGAMALIYLLSSTKGGGEPTVDPQVAVDAARAAAIYAHGGFADVTAQRAREFAEQLGSDVFMVPVALAVFLVGSWLLGAGPLSRPDAHRRFHRVLVFGVLPVGLVLCTWGATLATGMGPVPTDAEMLAQFLGWLGAPLMTLGYIGAIALLTLRPAAGAFLRRWLAPAGRMALTNYLMASLICSTLFYGYGFGLWGQVSRAGQVGIVAAVFVVQTFASRWWLARYRYGPMEWLWRAFTWWRLPPLRR